MSSEDSRAAYDAAFPAPENIPAEVSAETGHEGYVLKTAILPRGPRGSEWEARRKTAVDGIVARGVLVSSHEAGGIRVTGHFKDVLGAAPLWRLGPDRGERNGVPVGPVEEMDLWLLEQPGDAYFRPL
jgi:hypothetical protein